MENTKHFKATEDWQRQQDDWGDRKGEAAHKEEQGKKNISLNCTLDRDRKKERQPGKKSGEKIKVTIFFYSLPSCFFM